MAQPLLDDALWARLEPLLPKPRRRARRRTSHASGLGVFRWVVERTLSWLHRFRRLAVRYERQDRPSRLPHAGVRADLLELPKVNWESVLKRALMLLMIKSNTGSPPCRPSRHRRRPCYRPQSPGHPQQK